jgi:hypothetical protein
LVREYKVIVEDSVPKADLEARLETRINNLTVDGWLVENVFQGTSGVIVLMVRKVKQSDQEEKLVKES